MAWITLKFNPPLDEPAQRLLMQIPGVRFKGEWSACPDHALDLVRDAAKVLGRSLIPYARPVQPILKRIPLIREWVPKFMVPYQQEGVAHALTAWAGSNDSGMFVWAAGSGKTLAGVVWACAAGEDSRTVVVTKSAIRLQYRDEIDRFTEAATEILEGQKPGALPTRGFVVIGYDVLPFWANEIASWRPHSVIFDESHKVKTPKRWNVSISSPPPIVTSGGDPFAEGGDKVIATITPVEPEVKFSLRDNQAAAAFVIARAARRRLNTTATPLRDRVRDLWAQLDLVRPYEFGPYLGPRDPKTGDSLRSGFAWRYCAAMPGQFGGVDDRGMSNAPELKERLRFVTHYVPFSLANRDLPPKRRIVTTVRVSEQNRSTAIAEDIKRAAKVGDIKARQAAIVEARLWEAASRKRKRLVELVRQGIEWEQKIVVFTGRRRDCEDLEKALRTEAMAGRMWMAHGGHSDIRRHEVKNEYMAAKGPAVLIGTSDAWGEGLNLQDTDHLLVAMLPVTPGQVIQIEGRVARLGQTRPVLIQYLIAESSIDERVAQILLRKLPAVEKVTDTDEVRGIAYELAGADDDTLIAELAAAVGG